MARLLMLLLLLLPGAAQALDERHLADGRWYLIEVPEGVAHPPLIVALHGGGGNPRQFARSSGLVRAALARGYAVAFPAGSGRTRLLTWNAGHCCAYAQRQRIDDIGFLDRVVADAAARYGTGKVFVTGMSNGAMMASAWAAERPGEIAAAAPVAGTLDLVGHPPKGRVPFLHLHGRDDRHVPVAGGVGDLALAPADYAPAERDVAAFAARWPGARQSAAQAGGTERIEWRSGGRLVAELMVLPGGHEWFGGRRAGAGAASANALILDWFDRWR